MRTWDYANSNMADVILPILLNQIIRINMWKQWIFKIKIQHLKNLHYQWIYLILKEILINMNTSIMSLNYYKPKQKISVKS
jgi:hypothetical protein